ncbi:hypothetical protein IC235_10165 [Hymenobacter sp. BT664]|uniref:Uncharacterized protein n=1 Tax=Hymenobacter montanus TaxID=2771359 RepID=A0A927BD37_9BACT|nr:hypothetical protein [Hymenobacter montanus]MBD2768256.1 hypothetical protein [Hymenobacter montanus]
MFRRKIDPRILEKNLGEESNWIRFENALAQLPSDKIIFPPVVNGAFDEGKRLWLKDEMDLIKGEFIKEYPLDWYGAEYVSSVNVPAVDDPYEAEYTGLAFKLEQSDSGWVFARNEAIVNYVLKA